MSEYLVEDLEWLIKDRMNVNKQSNRSLNEIKEKILYYNKGYIQYSNEEPQQRINQGQDDTTVNIENSVWQYGYPIKKAGVRITNIIKNQVQIGWTDFQKNEFKFSFQFKMKDKINYNPCIEKQKKDKEKKKQQPLRELNWVFLVRSESQIQQIKYRIQEQQELKIEKEKQKRCDDFISKFDSVEIEIYDSETLDKQLKEYNIEDMYFGYIFEKLKNPTFQNIVAADLMARSYYRYLTKQSDYQINKLQKIKAILQNNFKKQVENNPNLQQNNTEFYDVQQIEKTQYNFQRLEKAYISHILLLNSLMYHLKFSINLNVDSLLKAQSFFECLEFSSIRNQTNGSSMGNGKQLNFKIFQQQVKDYIDSENNDISKLQQFKKYCLELFGEPKRNHYYAKLLVDCFKKTKNLKQLQRAIEIYQKYLSNQHPLYKEALKLKDQKPEQIQYNLNINQNRQIQDSLHQTKQLNVENTLNQLSLISFHDTSVYIMRNLNSQNQQDNQISEATQMQIILFSDSQQNQPHPINQSHPINQIKLSQTENKRLQEILKQSQSSDSYLFQQAQVNAQNDKLSAAILSINQIVNKDKRVLKLGFKLEKELKDKKQSSYATKLFQYYLINGYQELIDLQWIGEILEHTFQIYIEKQDSSLNDQLLKKSQKPIIKQL
ncbi:unnamed protein product [Paramecium sonneborni]|uniref:Uncharacterized protein n=1 Tax=Paramecium sonneborni TaxID=65129 RepID=A0A8S1PQY7_9CILI|nr:unnamed protein product [Paramecium sonneborni]